MSFQTIVTERLAQITETLNGIATNAKKTEELPVQNVLDPESLLRVSRDGKSESLTLKKIIAAVASQAYDQILSMGEITLVGNSVTIPANGSWLINGIYYGNVSAITRTIPYATTGMNRIDILVANTSNTIVVRSGIESVGIAVRPNVPIDTILVTELNVTDSTIDSPVTPIVVSNVIQVGQFLIFKRLPNINRTVLEMGDYVTGIVEGVLITGLYTGGNTSLLSSFNIFTNQSFE